MSNVVYTDAEQERLLSYVEAELDVRAKRAALHEAERARDKLMTHDLWRRLYYATIKPIVVVEGQAATLRPTGEERDRRVEINLYQVVS